MSTGLTPIRLAQNNDRNRLLDIVIAATHHLDSAGIHQWDDRYPDQATVQNDIDAQSLYVIEIGEKLAGMITLNDKESPEYQSIHWQFSGRVRVIHRLTIDPSHQRQGLASRLLEFAESNAKSLGYDTIRLDAFSQNPAALALYEHRAYLKAGTVQFRKGCFFCFEKPL